MVTKGTPDEVSKLISLSWAMNKEKTEKKIEDDEMLIFSNLFSPGANMNKTIVLSLLTYLTEEFKAILTKGLQSECMSLYSII